MIYPPSHVRCEPGFDGGLDQVFSLEVMDVVSGIMLANVSTFSESIPAGNAWPQALGPSGCVAPTGRAQETGPARIGTKKKLIANSHIDS